MKGRQREAEAVVATVEGVLEAVVQKVMEDVAVEVLGDPVVALDVEKGSVAAEGMECRVEADSGIGEHGLNSGVGPVDGLDDVGPAVGLVVGPEDIGRNEEPNGPPKNVEEPANGLSGLGGGLNKLGLDEQVVGEEARVELGPGAEIIGLTKSKKKKKKKKAKIEVGPGVQSRSMKAQAGGPMVQEGNSMTKSVSGPLDLINSGPSSGLIECGINSKFFGASRGPEFDQIGPDPMISEFNNNSGGLINGFGMKTSA